MGEYRRFVSYLYDDNGAEKGKNAGFVRVEVRGTQVSFRIGLKDAQGVGQAVLLSAGRELVALGSLRLTEERETEKLTADRENVQASGLRFEDFSGMRIDMSDSRHRYQTFWDTRVSPQTKFAWRGEDGALEKMRETVTGEIMPEKQQEPQPEAENAAPWKEQQPGAERTIQMEEEPQGTENTILPEESRQEEKKVFPSEELHQKGIEESLGEEALSEDVKEMAPEEVQEKEMESAAEEILPEELTEETTAQSVPYTELWREEPRITWPQLQNIYPKLLTFGNRDSWQVLRIHLQDIGRLPREYWILGNNDFVVHGYEAYHHLLLIHDPAGDITYLGVPGEELPQERRVAELFGFRRYRRAEPVGYWLTRIKL